MKGSNLPELVLVEDTADDEIMSLRGIAASGVPCGVTVRRDGAEALEHLLNSNPAPALVILDHRLPKVSGLEILQQLRESQQRRCVPVVMFSGTTGFDHLEACYRSGANSYVCKPDDPRVYVERLASVIRYWLTVNDPCNKSLGRVGHLQ